MLCQFAAGLFHQLLKRRSIFGEATLQSARAQAQFPCHIMYAGTLPCEQLLQCTFYLLAEVFLGKLPLQFGLKLRRNRRQQIGVIGDERGIHIGLVEHEDIPSGSEFDRALKVRFIHLPICLRPPKFDAFRVNRPTGPAPGNGQDPGETDVNQQRPALPCEPGAR